MQRGRAPDASEGTHVALVRIQPDPMMVNAQADAIAFRGEYPKQIGAKYRHTKAGDQHRPPSTTPILNPRSNAMLEALVRFIEELIDVFNFGDSINK